MTALPMPHTRPLRWPDDFLEPTALGESWRPHPFQVFVVKLHARCNLACDYCYVYEMADQSWRLKPRTMSDEVMDLTARRIAEHVRRHELPHVDVVLHGGEPLLAGTDRIWTFVGTVRALLPRTTAVSFSVQSNGLLLDTPMLETLKALEVRVGVSLDGDRDANDRHRRFPDGRPSHDRVADGIGLLRSEPYRHLLYRPAVHGGHRQRPDSRVRRAHCPPATVDRLPPPARELDHPTTRLDPTDGETPYGDWLVAAFDRWYDAPVRETRVRLFEDVMSLLMGGRIDGSEQIGVAVSVVLVVDTDGSIEQFDTLKSTFDGGPATGLTVHSTDFDDVLCHPSVIARQIGIEALAPSCRACHLRDVCGGVYYAHRYREDSGFLHRSVFCADLMRFIEHVRGRLGRDLRRLRSARTTETRSVGPKDSP